MHSPGAGELRHAGTALPPISYGDSPISAGSFFIKVSATGTTTTDTRTPRPAHEPRHPKRSREYASAGMTAKWPKAVPATAMPPMRPRRLLNHRETGGGNHADGHARYPHGGDDAVVEVKLGDRVGAGGEEQAGGSRQRRDREQPPGSVAVQQPPGHHLTEAEHQHVQGVGEGDGAPVPAELPRQRLHQDAEGEAHARRPPPG